MWKVLLVLALFAGVAGADPKVTVRSSTDSSRSTTSDVERKNLEDVVRHTIDRYVARAPVTLPANRIVDASIVSLTTEIVGTTVVVTSVIRLVVSDEAGRITAVLSGGAKVEKAGASQSSLSQLRVDALIGSLDGIYLKVKGRLHAKPSPSAPAGR
jgi:hypothetical protein